MIDNKIDQLITEFFKKRKIDNRRLSPYKSSNDEPIDEQTLRTLMSITNKIKSFIQLEFKKLKPKYYKITGSNRDSGFTYDDLDGPHLDLFGILGLEWTVWGVNIHDPSIDKACYELTNITEKIFINVAKRMNMKIGNPPKTEPNDNIVLLTKDKKIIFSVGAEGDKCEDLQFSIRIYGSNIKKYHNVDARKYGYKILKGE